MICFVKFYIDDHASHNVFLFFFFLMPCSYLFFIHVVIGFFKTFLQMFALQSIRLNWKSATFICESLYQDFPTYVDSKYEDLSIKRYFSRKKKRVIFIFFKVLGGFENVDHRLTGLTRVFGNYPCKETFEDLVKAELSQRIATLILSSFSRMFH